jgi:hypothetical protein
LNKYNNLRNRPFLIVRTVQRPAVGVQTHRAGWAETPRNWGLFEQIVIKDRVPNKDMREATAIVDLMRGETVSSRFSDKTGDEIVDYYMNKYREECTKAIEIWLNKVATRMANDPSFAAPKPTVEASQEAQDGVSSPEGTPEAETIAAPAGEPANGA